MKDTDKAIQILQKTLSCVGDNMQLYTVFISMLKNLNPSANNAFVKMIEICDKALSGASKLTAGQKKNIAQLYLAYLHENCSDVSYVRSKH